MKLYAIYNAVHKVFLRYGINGGGEVGYILFREGPIATFPTKRRAQAKIEKFDRPEDYVIRSFEEAEG